MPSPMTVPPPVPALPDVQRYTSYAISAETGPFSVNFALYGDGSDYQNWIEVWLNDVEIFPTGGYTMSSPSGSLGSIARPITDATITLSAAATGTLVIIGARRPRRLAQFTENQGVAARDLNQALTDQVADLREAWDFARTRQLYFPGGENLTALMPIASARANKIFTFDGLGNPELQALYLTGTAGVLMVTITRSQIPSVVLPGDCVVLSGYAAAGDACAGAMYTSVGAGPSGPMAIQDASGTWWQLVLVGGIANVKFFGALGDGFTDDTAAIQAAVDACFTSSPNSGIGNAQANFGELYFPKGKYNISAAIQLIGIMAGIIRGAGRGTAILNATVNGMTMFEINGMAFSVIADLGFEGNNLAGTIINLDCTGSNGVTQSNTLRDLFLENGGYGVYCGLSHVQVSETTFINCRMINLYAGVYVADYNSLSHCMWGGDISDCFVGIWVNEGNFPIVDGTGFQGNNQDIQIDNSSQNTYHFSGIRTESSNFILATRGTITLSGCEQSCLTAGIFFQSGYGTVTMLNCRSFTSPGGGTGSQVIVGSGAGAPGQLATLIGCAFGADLFANFTGKMLLINCWFAITGDNLATGYFVPFMNYGAGNYTQKLPLSLDNFGIDPGWGSGNSALQATSKTTTVVCHGISGFIVTTADSMAAGATIHFTLTNDCINTNSIVLLQRLDAPTVYNSYLIAAYNNRANGTTIAITNLTGSALAEQIQIGFLILNAPST